MTEQDSLIFDEQAVKDRLDSDSELLKELLDIFFNDYDTQYSTDLQLDKGVEKVISSAHSLKSASGNLGAMRVYNAASVLEESLRRNGICENAQQQIDQLKNCIAEFREYVLHELQDW